MTKPETPNRPEFVNAADFINKASSYVSGARHETHGDKGVCFRAMDLADELLVDLELNSPDTLPAGVRSALRMVLYKVCRIYSGSYNPDDFIDIAGYAGCAGEVAANAEFKKQDLTTSE